MSSLTADDVLMRTPVRAAMYAALTGFLLIVFGGDQGQAQEAFGGDLLSYRDTIISGIVAAEVHVEIEECRKICVARTGCLGFDYGSDGTCRIFASISSASEKVGTMAETREPLPGYREPISHSLSKECEEKAAPKLAGSGVQYELLPVWEAVKVCKLASLEAAAQPQVWAYYARALRRGDRFQEALEWARKSSDTGNAVGRWFLGVIYDNPQGTDISTEQGKAEAIRLYRLSSEQGYAPAQYNLAVKMENGDGIEKDRPSAIRLFKLAANQGYDNAQFRLGLLHELGRGVTKDREEAIRLYRLAADQGNVEARRKLQALENGIGK